MQIVTSDIGNDDTINIRTAESLDLTALGMITRVSTLVRYPQIRYVVIDLENTRYIRDSGLAMLILLRKRIGKMVRHITIANCRPVLKNRLSAVSLTTGFRFAEHRKPPRSVT
jgi:anti-anti-sigma regulatory factor